ncbi:MAG: tRNA uridine-5-carboxymethylaminomethyl(34) synthesis enzyme MnmG [Paracoccaceae bacterium]
MFHVKQFDFDVVVIGGGHAGMEAAHAAARMGVKTALITMRMTDIGVMSCNPAVGGLGKGHLVREIDALDGVMGCIADKAGIQFRLLNRRKGPAVQGPRAQADRLLYQKEALNATRNQANLSILIGEVVDLIVDDYQVLGVVLADGSEIGSRKTILTSGTFLRGVIHIGEEKTPAGRMGDSPSIALAQRLDDFTLATGRLKTGTPPRLDGKTIDWEKLQTQPGDKSPVMFSFLSKSPSAKQIDCRITHTNEKTHEIISANLGRSAMYSGRISGVGPRYCPSIEDKVVRFAEKASHQIFLEPESLSNDVVYPNGISTSLPISVQQQYVESILGLESAKILQPGYAIEYDFLDPRGLDHSLAVRAIGNLFMAGQINGTTGYEEAAAQGLVAGLNAALSTLDREEFTFSRSNSYIGVMIDDLITRGVVEPYRMFTSRAEFRLSLRADNADQRLTGQGIELGCVSKNREIAFQAKMKDLEASRRVLEDRLYSPTELAATGFKVSQDGERRSLLQLLAFPDVSIADVSSAEPRFQGFSDEIKTQLSIEALYSNYLDRQRRDIEILQRDEKEIIPGNFDYAGLDGLSSELKAKFTALRPQSIAHASKIDGVTPAALALILVNLKQGKKRSA